MRAYGLMAACVLLSAAWLGLAPFSAALGFVGHMGIHVTVIALAAPLVAIGLAGTRWDPTPHAPLLFAPMIAKASALAVSLIQASTRSGRAPMDSTSVRSSPEEQPRACSRVYKDARCKR